MYTYIYEIWRRKKAIREEALARRARLPEKDYRSLLIWRRLLQLPEFQTARTILCYVHYGDEVRTQPFLRWLLGEADNGLFETVFGQPEPFCEAPKEPSQLRTPGPLESKEPRSSGADDLLFSNLSDGAREPPKAGQAPAVPSFFSDMVAVAHRQDRQVLAPYCQGEELKLFRLRSMAELAPGAFGILEPLKHLRLLPERQAAIQQVDLALAPGVAFDRQGGRLGHGRGYYDRLLAQARPDAILVGLAYDCQIVPELPLLPSDIRMHKLVTESQTYLCRIGK